MAAESSLPGDPVMGLAKCLTFPDEPADSGRTTWTFVPRRQPIHADLIALRRDIHRNPELGNDLPRTQGAVLRALKGLPLEIHTGVGLSSVIAVLRGTAEHTGAEQYGRRSTEGSATFRITMSLRQ